MQPDMSITNFIIHLLNNHTKLIKDEFSSPISGSKKLH